MRLLLDTNALIWVLSAPSRLSEAAAEVIRDEANDIFVSVVSIWEIGVKQAKGKLKISGNLESAMEERSFSPLPLTLPHALAIESLPPHHHDPFDRMLVAQAQIEDLVLVTSDRTMQLYPIAVMPAL